MLLFFYTQLWNVNKKNETPITHCKSKYLPLPYTFNSDYLNRKMSSGNKFSLYMSKNF